MPSVVDSLIVTLSLDPANFTKGQKEAADALLKTQKQANRTAKEMQQDGAKAAQFFSGIKTEALSLIGVLLGGKGIEAFARDQTRSLADLGREAKNIGISVPTLAAFRNAVERNGGSAEAATASFQGLTDQMEHLKVYGNSPLMPFLNIIGAARGDDAMATYMKFVKFAQDHANDVPLINLVGKGLGLDQGSVNEAMRGVAKVNGDLARSYELGVPTPEMVERVTAMQNALIGLEQAVTGAGNHLLSDAAPGIAAVATALADWIAKNPHEAETIGAISTALTTLAAVRISANLMGLTGLAATIGSISLALAAIVALGYGPDMGQNEYADSYDKARAAGPEAEKAWEDAHPSLGRDTERWWHKNMPTWLGGGGNPPLADATMTPEQQGFLKSLSAPESGGQYDIKNGWSPSNDNAATRFKDFSHFPEGVAPGGTTSAAGRYQFTSDTWKDVSRALGLHDFSPASQDRGAWYLADREYRNKTGRNLQSDLASGGHESDIATALNGRWPSLPGGSQYRGKSLLSPKLEPSSARPAVPAPPPLPSLPRPPVAPAPAGTPDGKNMTIGSVNIHTQATDAKGIARDFKSAMVTQANRGAA